MHTHEHTHTLAAAAVSATYRHGRFEAVHFEMNVLLDGVARALVHVQPLLQRRHVGAERQRQVRVLVLQQQRR